MREHDSQQCPTMAELRVLRPGRLEYEKARALQEELVARRRAGEIPDSLILLEHDPVITIGRSPQKSDARPPIAPPVAPMRTAVVSRGGQATYHGPGQLVGYPILDLRCLRPDLHWYLRQLEAVIIRALSVFGLRGETVAGQTGVWIDGGKVASIGIAVRGWVSYHGFALNVDCDMAGFSHISPCGLDPEEMTRMADHGCTAGVAEVIPAVVEAFGEVFRAEVIAVEAANPVGV